MSKMLKKIFKIVLMLLSFDTFILQYIFAQKDDLSDLAKQAKAAKMEVIKEVPKEGAEAQKKKPLPETPSEKMAREVAEAQKKKPLAETPSEKMAREAAEAQKKKPLTSAEAVEIVKKGLGGAQAIEDMGPYDKIFGKVAIEIVKVFPQLGKLSQQCQDINANFANSALGRAQTKANNFSRKFKSKIYGSKSFASEKDIENLIGTPEYSRLQVIAKEQQVKDLSAQYQEDDKLNKKDALNKAQGEVEKMFNDPKKLKNVLVSTLASENLEKITAKKISDLKSKDPKKFAKIMDKIQRDLAKGEKGSGVYKEIAEQIAKVLGHKEFKVEDFNKLDVNQKNALLTEIIKESIKDDLKKTWYDKYQEDLQNRRQKFSQAKYVGGAVAISGLVQVFAFLIGREAEKAAKNMYGTPRIGQDSGSVKKDNSSEIVQTGNSYGDEKLTPEEQKNLDALKQLATYYSGFDAKFKNVLSKFDYDAPVFQVIEKVKFVGGEVTAGVALLFDYKGAGNIADGLTPIVIRFYPMQILGNAVEPAQALFGVTNLDSLEIISGLRSCSPDIIFFIKAISLLNTANKKFTDVSQRQSFLTDQMNLLFSRFLRTVDDEATRRSNSIEKDDEKWDSVYMKNPAQCFVSAPKVLRDYMAELTVETLDEDGKVVKTSFEQYVIDQFDMFDEVLNVEFEGDVDFEIANVNVNENIDDASINLRLFAIFARALDDVLRVKKDLLEETTPVTIKDSKGKVQLFDSKKFYMDVTKVAFDKLRKAQKTFIDASVEFSSDMADAGNLKIYNSAYVNYMKAVDLYSKAELEFRKKVSFYSFEKTLGYAPERIFDFVKRECKRAYQQSKNRPYFISVLPKIFEPFAENFPFSGQDLLTYSQEAGPVKSPVKLVVGEELSEEVTDKAPEKIENKVKEKITVNGNLGA